MKQLFDRYRGAAIAIISGILFGLIAHGYILTNRITIHDNVYNFYIGGTYIEGRWMLGLMGKLMNVLAGSSLTYYTPLLGGLLTILFFSMAAGVITELLGLKNPVFCAIAGGIMTAFPAITSLMAFGFTARFYGFGCLMGCLGTLLVCRAFSTDCKITKAGIVRLIAGILLQAACVGTYQTYIGIIAALMIAYMIGSMSGVIVNGETGAKAPQTVHFLIFCIYHLAVTVAYMIVYAIATKFFLAVLHLQMSSYQGMDSLGRTGIGEYLAKVPTAYKEFFNPTQHVSRNMYPEGLRVYYLLCLILFAVLLGIAAAKAFRRSLCAGILTCVSIITLPLAINLIYVMTDVEVHSLMMYPEALIFVLLLWLTEKQFPAGSAELSAGRIDMRHVMRLLPEVVAGVLCTAVLLLDCRLANVAYTKADYMQTSAVQYLNRLIERIESCEGYSPDYPVTLVGSFPVPAASDYLYPEFENVELIPFGVSTIVNDYNWVNFMKSNCGYAPYYLDPTPYSQMQEVREMNSYPEDGFVRVIDGVVVVKFADM